MQDVVRPLARVRADALAIMKAVVYVGVRLFTAAVVLACAFSIQFVYTVSVFLPTLGIEQRVITSESMMPTYYVDDRVWYHSPSGADLVPGRAVGIQFGDDFYTHRVVSVDPVTGLATLKGDGQANFDVTQVSQENVAGVPFHVTTDAPTLWVFEQLENRWVVGGISLVGILTLFGWMARKRKLDARDKREHDEGWARVATAEERIRVLEASITAAGIPLVSTSSAPDGQARSTSLEGDNA